MTMTSSHLNGHHRKTLASIFSHPEAHNLEWHDILSLLNNVGVANERPGGGYEVTIGADRIDLGQPHGKDLAGDDLRHLRAFLTKAGLSPDDNAAEAPAEVPVEHHCIVLIDHQHARLFGLGNEPLVLKPEDADGSARRLEHKQGNDDHDGGHAAEEIAWYERIAVELKPAHHIAVLSDGKGRSNAGAYLVAYLERHHPGIAARIAATERVDISHMSDGEIVAAGVALLEAGKVI